MGASSDLGQPFCPRKKKKRVGLGWGKIGYHVTTGGLPSSITDNESISALKYLVNVI